MKRYTLLCSLSIVLACGGDDESSTASDPTFGMTGETDATTGNTTDDPTTNPTSSPTTDDTTGPTTDPDTGDTEESDDAGETSTETGDDTADPISFAQEIWPIVDVSCGCHKNASHPSGLVMADAAGAYGNLLGVASSQLNSMSLVQAGSATDSYFWHKVNGTHTDVGGSGNRMPAGGADALPQAQNDLIADWIDAGAEP